MLPTVQPRSSAARIVCGAAGFGQKAPPVQKKKKPGSPDDNQKAPKQAPAAKPAPTLRKPLGIDDMAEYLKQSLQASNRHMLQYGSGALRELPPRASAAEAPSASTSAARAGPATAEQAPSPDRDDLEGLVDEVLGPQGLNGSLPVDPADLPEELQGSNPAESDALLQQLSTFIDSMSPDLAAAVRSAATTAAAAPDLMPASAQSSTTADNPLSHAELQTMADEFTRMITEPEMPNSTAMRARQRRAERLQAATRPGSAAAPPATSAPAGALEVVEPVVVPPPSAESAPAGAGPGDQPFAARQAAEWVDVWRAGAGAASGPGKTVANAPSSATPRLRSTGQVATNTTAAGTASTSKATVTGGLAATDAASGGDVSLDSLLTEALQGFESMLDSAPEQSAGKPGQQAGTGRGSGAPAAAVAATAGKAAGQQAATGTQPATQPMPQAATQPATSAAPATAATSKAAPTANSPASPSTSQITSAPSSIGQKSSTGSTGSKPMTNLTASNGRSSGAQAGGAGAGASVRENGTSLIDKVAKGLSLVEGTRVGKGGANGRTAQPAAVGAAQAAAAPQGSNGSRGSQPATKPLVPGRNGNGASQPAARSVSAGVSVTAPAVSADSKDGDELATLRAKVGLLESERDKLRAELSENKQQLVASEGRVTQLTKDNKELLAEVNALLTEKRDVITKLMQEQDASKALAIELDTARAALADARAALEAAKQQQTGPSAAGAAVAATAAADAQGDAAARAARYEGQVLQAAAVANALLAQVFANKELSQEAKLAFSADVSRLLNVLLQKE